MTGPGAAGSKTGGAGPRARLRIYSIAPGVPFVDALARGMTARVAAESPGDPLALARATVLLPTRRSVRALREAFLRATVGRPLLLPRMTPLGDLDEDEIVIAGEPGGGAAPGPGAADLAPAIGGMRRQMMLARLVLRFGDARWREADPAQAVELAAELARLLDQMETERVGFERLEDIRPADAGLARHWDDVLAFLAIVTRHWPKVLAEESAIGPAERRNRLLAAQAARWTARPPDGWVIAAGSTGSIPATADLLAAVAALPKGCVVLPGFDTELSADDWQALPDGHPQAGLAHLLDRFGVGRDDVRPWGADWPAATAGPAPSVAARVRLLGAALSPSPKPAPGDMDAALADVSWIEAPSPEEEGAAIALILRGALNVKDRTAALVTPDRGLARRVAAKLGRWGIDIDDSAGTPLAATPLAAFLRLVADMAASRFDALAVLACLQHPFAAGGMARHDFRAHVRALDRLVLRGPAVAAGLDSLRARIAARAEELAARADSARADAEAARRARSDADRAQALLPWFDGLVAGLAPLADLAGHGAAPVADIARAHIAVAEALAATGESEGAMHLWRGEEAQALADFFADLAISSGGFPPLGIRRYPELLAALLAGRVVRPRYGRHPRLAILGPLEARLQHVDVCVLGGLNEGTWPATPNADPWMSRPMRAALGLTPAERRIGLAAHDFAQGFAAPAVVLTRAQRVGGQPTVPSRWLLRLENAIGADAAAMVRARGRRWLARALKLDRLRPPEPPARPMPRPPQPLRPRRLSVTEIPILQVNPYAIYARHVLGLRPLEELGANPGAAERGSFIHEVMERFFARFPKGMPAGGEDEFRRALEELGRDCLGPIGVSPGLHAIWWPRFRDIARWIAAEELRRRAHAHPLVAEATGMLKFDLPGGAFHLVGRADRVDRLADGRLAIVDYKTGMRPIKAEDKKGFAPQLPLLGAMAEAGVFARVPPGAVAELAYWHLSGGEKGGEVCEFACVTGTAEAIKDACSGLIALIGRFDDAAFPYAPYVHPARVRFDDYAHLARRAEWLAERGEEEGE